MRLDSNIYQYDSSKDKTSVLTSLLCEGKKESSIPSVFTSLLCEGKREFNACNIITAL